ncbi:MAG: hypothetical protein KJ732_02480 [Candidatus Margulisbacteria bacterium]|nr:hypothetical protein [Candidatus Margulisiibacteriota bacterium]
MKKLFLLFLSLAFVWGLTAAVSAQSLTDLQAWLDQLNGKMETAVKENDTARIERLKPMIEQAKEAIAAKKRDKDEGAITAEKQDLTQLKEDVNVAIANLNSKIDKVNSSLKKGATVAGRAYIAAEKWTKASGADPAISNKFAIHRVYIDYKHNLDKDVAVRFTTDVGTETTLTAKNNIYLKYAYFDLNNFSKYMPWASAIGLNTMRLGQSATHWIDFMQNYWTFRYVEKTLTDYYGFFGNGSADLGAAALGSIGGVEYHATLMNGAGYKSAETDSLKNAALTLVAEPVEGVTAAVGYAIEGIPLSKLDTSSAAKKLTAMTAYNFNIPASGLVFVEYANNTDSSTTPGGTSIGGQYEILDSTNLFGRIDNYKKSGSAYVYNIYGIEYNWGSNIKLALDYRNETKDGAEYNNVIAIDTRVKW